MSKSHYILIKGDISGIQRFIFNVHSKGAAKALKARSFFIEAIGWLAETKIREYFPGVKPIYNGGGNFYLKLEAGAIDEAKFTEIKNELMAGLPPYLDVVISIVQQKCDDSKTYNDWVQIINTISSREKLQQFKSHYEPSDFFEPFVDNHKTEIPDKNNDGEPVTVLTGQKLFREFTTALIHNKYPAINKQQEQVKNFIETKQINLFGYSLSIATEKKGDFEYKRADTHIPLWNKPLLDKYDDLFEDKEEEDGEQKKPSLNTVIEFQYLAAFAKQRTGTNKIGVLKLDIDNLGSIFQKVPEEAANTTLSLLLTSFFTENLKQILGKQFGSSCRKLENGKEKKSQEKVEKPLRAGAGEKKETYYLDVFEMEKKWFTFKENLYVVFAGGDDCFIIGAWDAIIEFAILLEREFSEYECTRIRGSLHALVNPITLSASIIIVDSHFPVTKFASLAEDELHHAKHFAAKENTIPDASGKPMKGKVSFLDHIFTWKEFNELADAKDKMVEMVLKYGESKSFLQRIINSFTNVDTHEWINAGKPFDPALLWRFYFNFRDIRNKKYFGVKGFYDYFFGEGGIYQKYLWDAFEESRVLSQVLPVAARWAEFLTRQK